MIELIYLFKITLTLLLSSLIGLERENNHKSAGLRTCVLVGLSSTMFTLFSFYINSKGFSGDIMRIPSYCISGIGFLGAGVIMHTNTKTEGLTTASVLWSLVALGLLIGSGAYFLGIIHGFLVYIILKLKYVENKIKGDNYD